MANRIDTVMQQMEATKLEAVVYRPPAESQLPQLMASDHTMLSFRQLPDRPVGASLLASLSLTPI